MAEVRGWGRASPASIFHVARTRFVLLSVAWEVGDEWREDVASTQLHF